MTSGESDSAESDDVFIYNEGTKDEIPAYVTHVRVDPSVKEIHAFAFKDCKSLFAVEFSEGLEGIGLGAFWNCDHLTHMNKLPSTLKYIGISAFCNCESLVEVEFSEGLQKISKAAFFKCQNLQNINNFPSTLKEIDDLAFAYCLNLHSIEFPEGLQIIGECAFSSCRGLKSIKIPSAYVVIRELAFCSCIRLTSVDFPEGLQAIGNGWFLGCESLTHVRIPSSVVRIGCSAFVYCTRLISLELPEGLEMIDLGLLYDDEHDALRNIYGCKSLVNLVIPSEQHVQQLGDDGNEFMDDIKLGTVVTKFDDLVRKLQHRFDALPVHRLCYYQSYYRSTEALENLRQAMNADPSACTKVDSFGMTPFHILALAQTPSLALFQELFLKVNKVDSIQLMDKFGSTPADYLSLNVTRDSVNVLDSLLETSFAQRMQWLGLARWKSDISTTVDEAFAVEGSSRRKVFVRLNFKFATYERLEAMSLLELALWKVKIDEWKPLQNKKGELDKEGNLEKLGLVESDLISEKECADRRCCRIYSGADVVISNVLPFLDKVSIEDYYDILHQREDDCPQNRLH
jgi:hypothetical protein